MQESRQFLNDFLSPETNISVPEFILSLILTSILAGFLGYFYSRFGTALSNRKALAGTLILISITTMIIISIVKSSLALSLGLVGALSIVRFRTAVKEPEELAYFFIAISIGLGMGAGQTTITIVGSVFLFLVIFSRIFIKQKEVIQNLLISTTATGEKFDHQKIMEILGQYCTHLELRRLDETENLIELSIRARFKDYDSLIKSKEAMQNLHEGIQFSYIENI